jgi:glycine hydroxymethyltransferase
MTFTALTRVSESDPEIADAIRREERRQLSTLEMIASENFASPAVLEAQGCVMTNKYAEGYPGKRYYGGCEFVDEAETLALERCKKLFGADHANVQPHSGSQANMAVCMAALKPGAAANKDGSEDASLPRDILLGMALDHGGHLTHGHPINFSGRLYRCASYKVDPQTERLTADEVRRAAREAKPKLIIAGGSAYPRIVDFNLFREVADEVGALLMVDMAHFAGLIAGGVYPSPVPVADFVTSTTHKTLRGPRSGFILCKEAHAKLVDSRVFPGIQGGPLMHVVAAKAVAFGEALRPAFKRYARQIVANAQALGESLASAGFRLVSGGTDTHLLLVDLTSYNTTGAEAEKALEAAGITVNKNMIPFDKLPPTKTSGIRVGTPALTTRGLREAEMQRIGAWIAEVLKNPGDEKVRQRVRGEVEELTSSYPLHNADAFADLAEPAAAPQA